MERFNGQVDEASRRIDSDRVGVVADVPMAEFDQSILRNAEHRNDPALARHVQAASHGIDREDIRITPHAMDFPDLQGPKVHDEQPRTAIVSTVT